MFSWRVIVAIPKTGTALGTIGFSRAPLRGFADGGCEDARDQFRTAPPVFWGHAVGLPYQAATQFAEHRQTD